MACDYDRMEAHEAVDAIMGEASKRDVSDIYFLPGENGCTVMFKFEGCQEVFTRLGLAFGQQCVTRIKVMAQLLTYRNHIAQDGVIVDGEKFPGVEFRVAVMPSIYGERVTVRLRNSS